MGRRIIIDAVPEMKGGGWISKAVNKSHVGYCTPMTKATCTPRRKALAMTFKKHHGFHEYGGNANPFHPLAKFGGNPRMQEGGGNWQTVYNPDAIQEQIYAQRDNTQDVIQSNPDIYSGQPMVTSNTLTPGGNGTNPNYQMQGQQPGAMQPHGNSLAAWGNAAFGAGMLGLADVSLFNDIHQQKVDRLRNTRRGLSENSIGVFNQPGGHGDYTNQGAFRPDQMVPSRAGYFPGAMRSNGYMQHGGYTQGQELELPEHEIENLRRMGYQFEML